MPPRYTNEKHEAWIHGHPCALTMFSCCGGVVEGHHLMRPWHGFRGMGYKANDRNLIPLCRKHHRYLHDYGNEMKFFEKATGRADFGKTTAQAFWMSSPHYE